MIHEASPRTVPVISSIPHPPLVSSPGVGESLLPTVSSPFLEAASLLLFTSMWPFLRPGAKYLWR